MDRKKREKRIFAWELLPTVLSLAWPTMLGELIQTAVQYVDTAMVGSLGTAATAAVGSTVTVNWLVNTTIYAFGVGFLSQISQAFGAGDEERARRTAAQSVFAARIVVRTSPPSGEVEYAYSVLTPSSPMFHRRRPAES